MEEEIGVTIPVEVPDDEPMLIGRPDKPHRLRRKGLADGRDLARAIGQQEIAVARDVRLQEDVGLAVLVEIPHDDRIGVRGPGDPEVIARPALPGTGGGSPVRKQNSARVARVAGDIEQVRVAVAVEVARIEIVVLVAPGVRRGRLSTHRS